MRISAAALLLLADLAAFTWLARRVRHRPLPLAAAMGLALLVGWQATVVAALSPLGVVDGNWLAIAALVPPVVVLAIAVRGRRGPGANPRRSWRSLRWTIRSTGWVGLLVLPVAALLAVEAAAYAPSTWDSMTYHLARVAHWIQRGSVAEYGSSIHRQNLYAPGAEYVLLALQAISRSDRLASGLQLVAWLAMTACAAPLARLAGAPRDVARWAGPVAATAPMLVLQATSTQNDLVAAVMVLAVVAASLPFLHGPSRPRSPDLLVLSAVVAAAFLVKATAIVVAAPLLLLATPGVVRAARGWPRGRALVCLLSAAVAGLAIAGPQIARMARAGPGSEALTAPFVFPLVGDWSARATAVRLAAVRHLPASPDILLDLSGTPAALPPFHEDLAANPVQAASAIVGIVLLLLGWRRAPPRARWAGMLLVASWLLFQLTFRPNLWISRLETPLFALLPATMAGWRLLRPGPARQVVLGALALVATAFGLAAAIHNTSRPAMGSLASRAPADDYYVNRASERPPHDAALAVAAQIGCRRIGLLIGEDSYDYPLTWRAMQRGMEVRHVAATDAWPCVLVSDQGPPPPPRTGEASWLTVLRRVAGRQPDAPVVGGVWARPP